MLAFIKDDTFYNVERAVVQGLNNRPNVDCLGYAELNCPMKFGSRDSATFAYVFRAYYFPRSLAALDGRCPLTDGFWIFYEWWDDGVIDIILCGQKNQGVWEFCWAVSFWMDFMFSGPVYALAWNAQSQRRRLLYIKKTYWAEIFVT